MLGPRGELLVNDLGGLRDRLRLGGVTACTDGKVIFPVTIEAYSLPGESLSRDGWVQWDDRVGFSTHPAALRR